MGFLGFGKRKDFIDLTNHLNRQEAESLVRNEVPVQESATSSGFDFLSGLAGAGSQQTSPSDEPSSEYVNVGGVSETSDDKKRKLKQMLNDLTDKLEDISNQIYHLQQRVELLERKAGVGNFG